MDDDFVPISYLNDFIFCPVSIYFHQLYGDQATITYQCSDQINGTAAHETIDEKTYSTHQDVLQAIPVVSVHYKLVGKIDLFFEKEGVLIERKKKIKRIYDGYIFQLYAQYFCMVEMGYKVKTLRLYSKDDNKTYPIPLPEEDLEMKEKFESLVHRFQTFQVESFQQNNQEKCAHCIYEPACDRSLL